MSINTPIIQWIPNIKVDIHQILVMYRKVVIHRCKIACICGELQSFRSSLQSRVHAGQIASPKEYGEIQKLLAQIKILNNLVQSLSEEHYIDTILDKSPKSILQELRDFRSNFNTLALSLKFANSDPLPINPSQESVDDLADLQDILERLKFLKNEGIIPPEQTLKYDQRVMELELIIREYANEEEESQHSAMEKARILTQEEINEKIKDLQPWVLQHEDFELKRAIGHGAFADVYWSYQTSDKTNNRIVAVKRLKAVHFSQYAFELFYREISIFTQMNHPALLPFVGVTITPPFYIATEFMEGGCLYNRLHDREPLRDPTKLTIIALGIAHGMKYLHAHKIIHRDLKSLNVLLDANDFPKVCDFGMSRKMPENNEYMSGSVGTVQWMAPEVLRSERYNEKADVYSFGIVLWELVTGDAPFKQMRDVQVTLAVLSNNARPMMPPSVPPRLAKLIKVCWDNDPNVRPDFEIIAKMLESGELDFPGAKREDVQAYINLLNADATKEAEINNSTPTPTLANNLINLLSDPEKSLDAIKSIESLFADPQWSQLFIEGGLVTKLITLLLNCEDARVANSAVSLTAVSLKNDAFRDAFLNGNGGSALSSIISRLCSTSMSAALDAMFPVLSAGKLTLPAEGITKVAPFLVTTKINTRKEAADFISEVIDKKAFESEASLSLIVHNCLINAMPETDEALLNSIITLLTKLSLFQPSLEAIRGSTDGPKRLIELMKQSKDELAIKVLNILKKAAEGAAPLAAEVVQSFAAAFPSAIERGPQFASCALTTLALLSRTPNGPKLIISPQGTIPALEKCLFIEDDVVVALTLKVIAMLLMYRSIFIYVEPIAKSFKSKYNSQATSIKKLLACVLSAYMKYASNTWFDIIGDGLSDFIKSLFESKLTSDALKLCGTFACRFDGCTFLSKNNLVAQIVKSATNNNETKELAISVLAAMSTYIPFTPAALDAILPVMEAVKAGIATPYNLVFIANMSVNPKACVIIATQFSTLVNVIQTNTPDNIVRALITVQRAVQTPEAAENIAQYGEVLIPALKTLIGTVNEKAAISIISCLSAFETLQEKLISSEIQQILFKRIEKMDPVDHLRPQILNVISRLPL